MYFFERYPLEALTTDPEPYFTVSHGGHGVNSYALSYHLAIPGLTLVTQYGWGGAYMDNEAAGRDISRTFDRAGEVVEAILARTETNTRLVVIESDIRGVGVWGWLDGPLDTEGARAFLDGESSAPAIEGALSSVRKA